MMNALLLAAVLSVPHYVPLVEIVSASDTSVTYRELIPLRVALDPDAGLYHFKGCPSVRSGMQWVSPAAAQLKHLAPHTCASLKKDEYATSTVPRRPRDPHVVSVLFLGNSLTYFNEIPRLTAEVAKNEARPIRADQVTKSGVSLDQLWYRSEALKKLWLEHWDYVVLQERGGRAPHDRGPLFHQYLGMFADEVRKSGAQPLLYMTWLPSDAAENERLFRAAAARAKARLVPVGMAWAELVKDGPRLDVDGTHPNAAGAYLVACSVFAVVYGKPPPPGSLDFRRLASSENYDDSLRSEITGDVHGARIRAAAWRAVSAIRR
jgi:hypothetical protein